MKTIQTILDILPLLMDWKYPEVCEEDQLIRIMLMSFHSFKQFELYEHKPS